MDADAVVLHTATRSQRGGEMFSDISETAPPTGNIFNSVLRNIDLKHTVILPKQKKIQNGCVLIKSMKMIHIISKLNQKHDVKFSKVGYVRGY